MMRSQTLEEFAEEMRRQGDIRQSDLADEILMLVDLEADAAEPYSELCDSLDAYAPQTLKGDNLRTVEWLGDRSELLAQIEEQLEVAKLPGDVDDVIRQLLIELADARPVKEYDL